MTHTVEVVGYKKLSNGQFSLCLRCCANPSTDVWHTLAAAVLADAERRKDSLEKAKMLVAKEHEDAMLAEAAAMEAMGEVTEKEI